MARVLLSGLAKDTCSVSGLAALCKPSLGLIEGESVGNKLKIKNFGPRGVEIKRNFIKEWQGSVFCRPLTTFHC